LGAIALFGEKYGDKVRVVQFADSVEFCGGCHAKATGQIGMVKIMTESSVAAGVRRIEAITGEKVEEWLYKMQDLSTDLKALFNNAPDVKQAIVKAIEENGNLKKQLEENIREKANGIKNEIIAKAQVVNGVTIYRRKLPLMPAEFVKDMAFQLRNLEENTLVVLGSFFEDKPMLTVAASDNMVKEHGINVGKHIREAAKLIQGGGGGQPHFATAGGKNIDGLDAAIDKFIELAEL
jgi:alanyl-tRNA synthetase